MEAIFSLILAILGPGFAPALTVMVADAEGAPLAGAEVVVWGEEYYEILVTDDGGRARFPDVPPGSYSVAASASGFVGDEQHDVEVAEGAEVALHFSFPAGVSFSGRVVDRVGEPVAEAYVEAIAGGSFEGYGETRMRAPYGRAWTGEDGVFRIGGIPEGAVSTLLVRAEGFEEARVAVRAQGGPTRAPDDRAPVRRETDGPGGRTGRCSRGRRRRARRPRR
jgi:protocatechuate 3,4-dioxygenase beta subunit